MGGFGVRAQGLKFVALPGVDIFRVWELLVWYVVRRTKWPW